MLYHGWLDTRAGGKSHFERMIKSKEQTVRRNCRKLDDIREISKKNQLRGKEKGKEETVDSYT